MAIMIGGNNAWEAARCAFIKCFCDRYIPIRYDIEFADIADDYDHNGNDGNPPVCCTIVDS